MACAMKWVQPVLAVLCVVLLCLGQVQGQGQGSGETRKVLNLVFRVDNLGGRTEGLEVRQTGNELHMELAADVLFDFDKATILPKAQTTLEQAAQIIRDKAKGPVRIEGYTDAKGSDAYNQRLSEKRATAIKDWFVNRGGLRAVVFATKGFGAQNPVAPNRKPDGSDDPEGRAKNRRVEIILQTQKG
jgi:outer membrane protein OmpA-like peptidoglycan-associated protein